MKHIIKTFSVITIEDLVFQIVASANSQEKAIIIIKLHEQLSTKEKNMFEEELQNSLLQFEEPAIMNCINFQWGNYELRIEFTGWNGNVLLNPDGLMFVRRDCKISDLNQSKNDNRYFSPIVIR